MYELGCKAGLLKVLEARVATIEAKTDNSSHESLFEDERLKLMTETIHSLTESGAAPDRAEQGVDGYSH